MQTLIKVLIGLSALAFLMVVTGSLLSAATTGSLNLFSLNYVPTPEGLSRACTNLALLGIAFSLVFKES